MLNVIDLSHGDYFSLNDIDKPEKNTIENSSKTC